MHKHLTLLLFQQDFVKWGTKLLRKWCAMFLIMAQTLYVDESTSHNLSFSHLHIVWYQHWAATSISVLHHRCTCVQLCVKPLHLLTVKIKYAALMLLFFLFSADKSKFTMCYTFIYLDLFFILTCSYFHHFSHIQCNTISHDRYIRLQIYRQYLLWG